MPGGGVERRRGRRVTLEAPLRVRRVGTPEPESFREHVTKNIGLAGVYFETEDAQPYTLNEAVITSVSIPESQRRNFPFARLAGRSRVVRVTELPRQAPDAGRQFGVALEFGDDVTALTALPARG